ncbi:FecR family protein [Sphingomonas sp.]|jgi:transmembrane sensor|uniref:FecR family protein n=1 Tax=Sphingomonas sp. TaxID=28214 RepID=UPI002E36BE91|nr:FecR domain-containing protein [Sphingomonas sp.]HEX4693588.1 FecR domain-containing protein [Sphingomonas sp.]
MSDASEGAASRQQALDEAGHWLARMRGEPSKADIDALAAWRAADPLNDEAYGVALRNWEKDGFVLASSTNLPRNLGSARAWHRTPVARYAVAASLLLVLLGIGTIWTLHRPRAAHAIVYVNAEGRVRTFQLTDGSVVTLDSRTRLATDFSPTDRHVALEAGRARFDVARDPARPFVVSAGGGRVTADGSLFDVQIGPTFASVTALRGAIEVRGGQPLGGSGNWTQVLAPGRLVSILQGQARPQVRAANAQDVQWVSGMLSFDAVPLRTAVAAFNSRNPAQLSLGSERIAGLEVSGAFRADDPAGFAKAVAAMFKLDERRLPDGNLVLEEPKKR